MPSINHPLLPRGQPYSDEQLVHVGALAREWRHYAYRLEFKQRPKETDHHYRLRNRLARHPLTRNITALASEFKQRPNAYIASRLMRSVIRFERERVVERTGKNDADFSIDYRFPTTFLASRVDHPDVHREWLATAHRPGGIEVPGLIRALGWAKHPGAIPALETIATKYMASWREDALLALMRRHDAHVIPVLVRLLKRAPTSDSSFRWNASEIMFNTHDGLLRRARLTPDEQWKFKQHFYGIDPQKIAEWRQNERHPHYQKLRRVVGCLKTDAAGKVVEHPSVVQRALEETFKPHSKLTTLAATRLFIQQLREQTTRGRLKAG